MCFHVQLHSFFLVALSHLLACKNKQKLVRQWQFLHHARFSIKHSTYLTAPISQTSWSPIFVLNTLRRASSTSFNLGGEFFNETYPTTIGASGYCCLHLDACCFTLPIKVAKSIHQPTMHTSQWFIGPSETIILTFWLSIVKSMVIQPYLHLSTLHPKFLRISPNTVK